MLETIIVLSMTLLPPMAVTAQDPKSEAEKLLTGLERGPRQHLLAMAGAQLPPQMKVTAPLATVLSLPNAREFAAGRKMAFPVNWFNGMEHAGPNEPFARFASGELKAEPARSQSPAFLILIGPELNCKEGFNPVLLARDGKKLTLLVETWTDNAGRDKNIPARQVYLLMLGNLEAGKYELQVMWRGLFRNDAKGMLHYGLSELRFGRSAFTVYGEDDKQAVAGRLGEEDLKPVAIPAAFKEKRWQVPVHASRDLQEVGNRNGLPAPGLRLGAMDLADWLKKEPKTINDRPSLGKVHANSAVHAEVLGPMLNQGERMMLREVEWQGDEAVLKVDVWRDNRQFRRNVKTWPLLVAPLKMGDKLEAREYKARIEWTFLRAPGILDVYQVEEMPQGLAEKSRQGFKVGP